MARRRHCIVVGGDSFGYLQIAEVHDPTGSLRAPRGSEWLKKVRADSRNQAAETPNPSRRRSARHAPVYSPEGMSPARNALLANARKRVGCMPTLQENCLKKGILQDR